MTDSSWHPGTYSLAKLGRDLSTHLPGLLQGMSSLLPGLVGRERLELGTRIAVHLRLAKLMGCPVCLSIFPRLGEKAGLSGGAVEAAITGRGAGLAREAQAAVDWVEAVVKADGAEPETAPGSALELSATQRAHLVFMTRLETVVHSAGLIVLPRSMIERALGI
jgi:alkylhydroperoxidase family enzyme